MMLLVLLDTQQRWKWEGKVSQSKSTRWKLTVKVAKSDVRKRCSTKLHLRFELHTTPPLPTYP
jgi:hypothetical protein